MSKKINQQFNCSKMMLPEHCGQLREHSVWLKAGSQKSSVEADEQLLEEWQLIFNLALTNQLPLKVVYSETGVTKMVTGIPFAVEIDQGCIKVKPGNSRGQKILIKAILELRLSGGDPRVI
jgi:hypothetical protein